MLHEFRDLISSLKGKDAHFDKLFDQHNQLDEKIKNAENGTIFLNDMEISKLKKEKLILKDQLNEYLSNYQKEL
ncbi:YdcH family protein [Campylobacter sp. TTU-622]|uniref:YdcH family protein n=1 Tax=unclassified Campylobacter TaxID=2593542 RepID=UPI0019053604|nr:MULTISPECIES: YdcH family protein [unclassified Campylobacter]MBK1971422.1 YdcH family protein [Campylobacter sp. TTU_617]MBK1973153.1 YdcH family protein [Campylobacter sp. TTU-622]MBK1991203.1 YdcH family protein [Campylobacter sp. 2018MI34]